MSVDIGCVVVGLAVARALARFGPDVVLVVTGNQRLQCCPP
ncbi:hypothetical protein [Pseudomonas sp. Q11]|nr:hypothetical protein [Pseudomonas sp. Q11]